MYYVCIGMYPRYSREEVIDSGTSLNNIDEQNRRKKERKENGRSRLYNNFFFYRPDLLSHHLSDLHPEQPGGLDGAQTGDWSRLEYDYTCANSPVRSKKEEEELT